MIDMIHVQDNGPLFDAAEGHRRKEDGMALAKSRNDRPSWLKDAQRVAIQIARTKGTVTADDVVEYFAINGMNLHSILGNAMGSLFRDQRFEFTGEYRESRQAQRHSNPIRVWKLK